MAKFYNVESNSKREVSECNPFGANKQHEEVKEATSTYEEVLNIFKEALSYVDIMKIIKKL